MDCAPSRPNSGSRNNHIRPGLHHFAPLIQIGGVVVHVTDGAAIGVGQLSLDPVLVITAAVHLRGKQVSESVG